MTAKRPACLLAALFALNVSAHAEDARRFHYPETAKVEHTDDYHGTSVADPYRWLEDANSPQTQAWCAALRRTIRSRVDPRLRSTRSSCLVIASPAP